MIKKSNFYPALLSVILGVILLFGATSIGFAGEPPTGGGAAGKPSSGVLTVVTLYIFDHPFAVASIVGECSGKSFVVGPVVNDPIVPEGEGGPNTYEIQTITASQLENLVLNDADKAGCYEALVGPNASLIITGVRNFINEGTAISADVTLRAFVGN